MSYILDALKKSEANRAGKQNSFQLQPQPSFPAAVPAPAGSRLWILFWVILIALPPLGYWLYSQHSLQGADETGPASVEAELQEIQVQTSTVAANASGPEQSAAIPELRPVNNKKPPDAPDSAVELTVFEPAPLDPAPLDMQRPSVPLPISKNLSSVPYLEELDSSFRESVPEFNLAGHVYAQDPSLRLILINNQIVREKDVVAKDYVLEEITPEGIVLRSGNVRFRLIGY